MKNEMKILRDKISNMKDLFIFRENDNFNKRLIEKVEFKEYDQNIIMVNKPEEKKLNISERNTDRRGEGLEEDKHLDIKKNTIDEVLYN